MSDYDVYSGDLISKLNMADFNLSIRATKYEDDIIDKLMKAVLDGKERADIFAYESEISAKTKFGELYLKYIETDDLGKIVKWYESYRPNRSELRDKIMEFTKKHHPCSTTETMSLMYDMYSIVNNIYLSDEDISRLLTRDIDTYIKKTKIMLEIAENFDKLSLHDKVESRIEELQNIIKSHNTSIDDYGNKISELKALIKSETLLLNESTDDLNDVSSRKNEILEKIKQTTKLIKTIERVSAKKEEERMNVLKEKRKKIEDLKRELGDI
jgi:methyl-accepting chemotaxis protein